MCIWSGEMYLHMHLNKYFSCCLGCVFYIWHYAIFCTDIRISQLLCHKTQVPLKKIEFCEKLNPEKMKLSLLHNVQTVTKTEYRTKALQVYQSFLSVSVSRCAAGVYVSSSGRPLLQSRGVSVIWWSARPDLGHRIWVFKLLTELIDWLCCSVAFTHTSCYTVCVFVSFPPASASYILLQFAQYGNILRHTVRHTPCPEVSQSTCFIFQHSPQIRHTTHKLTQIIVLYLLICL